MRRPRRRGWATRLATVFGVGDLPWGPGTWGSLVGALVGLVAAPVAQGWLAAVGLSGAFVGCALLCTQAERQLRQHDPPSVVLDEVFGMAAVVIVLPWLASSGVWMLLGFALFRAFDILKPFPTKSLARLPAGWGIMADDACAAASTCLVLILLKCVR